MKLPARDYALPLGLRVPQYTPARSVWQAHLLKHPLGVDALTRSAGRDAWNLEGWDRIAPPLVTAPQRDQLVQAILALRHDGSPCGVHALHGRFRKASAASANDAETNDLACYACPPPLLAQCERICNEPEALGPRYAAVTEALLAAVEAPQAVTVTRAEASRALHRQWQHPERWSSVVLLTLGLDQRTESQPIVRLTRGDGVRAEFYRGRGNELRWRTTYASVKTDAPARLSFLLQMPRPSIGVDPMSDQCVLPRRWWEDHGV